MIAPALPPTLDGIGDYTARLAVELARSQRPTVLYPIECRPHELPGVKSIPAFSSRRRRSVARLADVIGADRPDWLILQFNQFSYGRWGLNPYLQFALQKALRRSPTTRLAVMFHEDFVPPTSWKFAIMRVWQRWQFKALGSLADVVLFSIDPWVGKYQSWFPGKPVVHLPVGSNIPALDLTAASARADLGIPDERLVLGLFGSGHDARMLGHVNAACAAARAVQPDAMLLYVGTNGASVRRAAGESIEVRDEGPLPAPEVSRRLRAMDVYLAPFIDGVSTRRGSMIAGLQHGLPVVATRGVHTDQMLLAEDSRAILLADVDSEAEYVAQVVRAAEDPELRRRVGEAAKRFHDRELTWERIAARLLDAIGAHDRTCGGQTAAASGKHPAADPVGAPS